MVRFAGNISTNVKHSANNILLEFSQIKLWGLSQMTSSPKGEGVSEMLTKPDMGGGGVRPMMTSAKKDI